jgi:ABC-type transporter Mla subunit MlaD
MTSRTVHRFAIRTSRALGLTMIITAAGCASENARFYTELTQSGSLIAGSRVVNLGAPIGSVASVSPLADGNAGVAFDVERADAGAVDSA